jgi:hypothetical protein
VKPWADGDIVSIVIGVLYLPVGLLLRAHYRTAQGWASLLGTGISLGTLMLIVADPLRQMLGFPNSLLAIALDEGRSTLWWSAACAAIHLVKDLFERPGLRLRT